MSISRVQVKMDPSVESVRLVLPGAGSLHGGDDRSDSPEIQSQS